MFFLVELKVFLCRWVGGGGGGLFCLMRIIRISRLCAFRFHISLSHERHFPFVWLGAKNMDFLFLDFYFARRRLRGMDFPVGSLAHILVACSWHV